jgi:ankyrin repeat protein
MDPTLTPQVRADIAHLCACLADASLWSTAPSNPASPRATSPRQQSPRSVPLDEPDYDVPVPVTASRVGTTSALATAPLKATIPSVVTSSGTSLGTASGTSASASASASVAANSATSSTSPHTSPVPKRRVLPTNTEKRKSIKDLDSHQQTLLHKTAFDGNIDDVEHLLRLQEIDVNAQDRAGWTCLLSAACNGHWRICKVLLKAGADVTIASFNGSSALHYLSKHIPVERDRPGYSKVFTLLIKRGASLAANSVGDTPLHSACSSGNAVAVQLVLAHWGHSVNLRNKADWTPFHFCAREGALDIAEMLVKRGADIDAKCTDQQRNTVVLPVDVARQSGRHAFVRMIEARRRDAGRLIKALLTNDNRAALAIVREHPFVACVATPTGAALSATTDPSEGKVEVGGRRVAHWFAARGDIQSLRGLLAERGAPVDLNVLDDTGRSPLHLACQYGDSKLVALLLESGASGLGVTQNGDTCLHILARRRHAKDKNWAAVYKLVLAAGANPARANKLGDLVLHTAALNGNDVLVRAVLACPNVDVTATDQLGRTALQCAAMSNSSACEVALSRAMTAAPTH